MLILENTVEANFIAHTPHGCLRAFSFQGRFFILQRTFQHLQEAVRYCRQEVEQGFVSLIVDTKTAVEIWSQVAEHITVEPFQPLPNCNSTDLTLTSNPSKLYYRGCQINLTRTALPSVQQPTYRGTPVLPLTTKNQGLPKAMFFRGQPIS